MPEAAMCCQRWGTSALAAPSLLLVGGCRAAQPAKFSTSSADAAPEQAPHELPKTTRAKLIDTAGKPRGAFPTTDNAAIVAVSHEQPAGQLLEASDVPAADPFFGEA